MKNLLVIAAIAAIVAVPAGATETQKKVTLYVEGMSCAGCAATVSHAVEQIAGVAEARVSYEQAQAVITYEPAKITPEAIAREAEAKLPGYKLSTNIIAAKSSDSPKSCARPAVATPSAIKPSELADRVSFYGVGLVCPAAPKIGCGSRSKPILMSLVADPHVAGAWLNEAGTRLAIGWKNEPLTAERLGELLADYGLAANALSDKARVELLASFHANQGWFDAASLDRLSEQEAGIIAARLVKRLSERVTITSEQRTALLNAIERTCRVQFITGEGGEIEKELVAVANEAHLDTTTLAALRQVVALGYRPLANEE